MNKSFVCQVEFSSALAIDDRSERNPDELWHMKTRPNLCMYSLKNYGVCLGMLLVAILLFICNKLQLWTFILFCSFWTTTIGLLSS